MWVRTVTFGVSKAIVGDNTDVERIRRRGDGEQAQLLERWLRQVSGAYANAILPIYEETAQVWGRLRVRNPENPLEKQIAATALIHDLTVVTR